jgi:soluble lytic murein transglycosylase-like protein
MASLILLIIDLDLRYRLHMSIAALFLSTTIQFQLPPGLLSSICYIESKHQKNAVHYNDGKYASLGICQIQLRTARYMGFKGTEEYLMQPRINIYYAGLYLKYQLRRYHGNVTKAVVAYNKGHAGDVSISTYSSQYCNKVFRQWRLAVNE